MKLIEVAELCREFNELVTTLQLSETLICFKNWCIIWSFYWNNHRFTEIFKTEWKKWNL